MMRLEVRKFVVADLWQEKMESDLHDPPKTSKPESVQWQLSR
jgi:hypothetical protein